MCGCSHGTEVDILIDFCQKDLLENFSKTVAAAADQCILTPESPQCQNTTFQGGILLSTLLLG